MGTKTWTDEQLAEAIASSTTWPQVATKLGISPGGGRYLKTWANRLGLDYSHFSGRGKKRTWTDQELAEAVAASTAWTQVATKLGISPGGGGYLKTWANRLDLDYSHFTGRGDRTWTDQQLAEAIASSTTWFQVAAKLGLASWCRSQAKSRADRIGLAYRHFTEHKNRPWTDQQLAEAIASSTTWTQVATKLGMTPGGGGYLKTWANRLGLDYSHFTGHRDRTWTDQELADAVATSKSWPQVRSKLGLAPTAMKMSSLRGHADLLELECAHLSVRDRRKPRAQRPGTGSWFAALRTGMDTTTAPSRVAAAQPAPGLFSVADAVRTNLADRHVHCQHPQLCYATGPSRRGLALPAMRRA